MVIADMPIYILHYSCPMNSIINIGLKIKKKKKGLQRILHPNVDVIIGTQTVPKSCWEILDLGV